MILTALSCFVFVCLHTVRSGSLKNMGLILKGIDL